MMRLFAIGVVVMTMPTFSAQGGYQWQKTDPTSHPTTRSLPTPQLAHNPSRQMLSLPESSLGLQILKQISQFLVREIFEPAYKADITMIKRIVVEKQKPERYGDEHYFTASEKEAIQDQLQTAIQDALEKVNQKLRDLEEQERTRETPFSDKEILRNFWDIYDTLNLVRKSLASRLSTMEKQELRTKTLKECPSNIDKIQSSIQKSGASVKRFFGRNYPSSEKK